MQSAYDAFHDGWQVDGFARRTSDDRPVVILLCTSPSSSTYAGFNFAEIIVPGNPLLGERFYGVSMVTAHDLLANVCTYDLHEVPALIRNKERALQDARRAERMAVYAKIKTAARGRVRGN